jgi:uncharacterized protein YjhX (UPF0386 family)
MENIDWQEIGFDSDDIERMEHSGNDLYVEFKSNTGYKYLNVPFEIFQRILNKECISKSKGRPSYGSTLHKLVKAAGFQYEQYK